MEILFPPNCKVVRIYIYIFFPPTLLSFVDRDEIVISYKSVLNSLELILLLI